MKKRLLAIFLALTMCLVLLPTAAVAADNSFVIENGVLTKYNYNGWNGEVVIPDGVTSIADNAFLKTGISSVKIPNSVTSIGNNAFSFCTGLREVVIPDSVVEIGTAAFEGCGLTSVSIGSGLTSISTSAFAYNNIQYLTIPGTVKEIGFRAFRLCGVLTEVVIEEGVQTIGKEAFHSCDYLRTVTIPDTVTEIGQYAFQQCRSLNYVALPSGITEIPLGAFSGCASLTTVAIPTSVKRIHQAFQNCALTDIYYAGTAEQWDAVAKVKGQRPEYDNAIVHYNSTGPDQPTTPTQPTKDTAHASAQTVTVDGKPVEFQMYALKDASGNDTNYIKLRDMAYVLNSTKAQFSVGYNAQDKTITATTGAAYKEDGTEMKATFGGADKEYTKTTLTIQLDGKPVQLEAITLTDDAGGGYNYCKVKDLGQTFNFNVDWNAGAGIYIESDKPYSGQ